MGSCSSPSVGVVSPRRAASLLRGSVKSLATGSRGSLVVNDDSVAEVTVSLSRSSGFSSHSPRSELRMRNWDEDVSQGSGNASNTHCHSPFQDAFQQHPPLGLGNDNSFADPYLDHSTRRRKRDRVPHRSSVNCDEPLEDFMTAYTSPEPCALDFDQLVSPQKITITKARVKSLIPASPKSQERLIRDQQQEKYWSSIVISRTKNYGTMHRQTAEALLLLGHAHMRLNKFQAAMAVFQSSCKIFKTLDGPTHLSVGRALDAYGLAALRYKQTGTSHLIQAKNALEEAFAIRFHSLGVWHVDTVETFNKIASVYLHLGRLEEAAHAYHEVFLVRKAIYGSNHPSVAISAHGLANVYLRLQQPQESLRFFRVAMDVYDNMRLPKDHPTVTRLLNDLERMEQLNVSA